MWRPNVKCPACGTVMPWRGFHAGKPWICPGRFHQFQIKRSRFNGLGLWAAGLALGASYLTGVRGWLLLVATVVLWFPFFLACIPLLGH